MHRSAPTFFPALQAIARRLDGSYRLALPYQRPPWAPTGPTSELPAPEKPTGSPAKRALILHGGGDAPGMNATLVGFARALEMRGWEAWAVVNGWSGLTSQEGKFVRLSASQLWGTQHLPGSLIRTGYRKSSPFDTIPGIENPLRNALDHIALFEGGLFVVGGNGSGWVAEKLLDAGARVFFTPGTIDGDILYMESIGFQSAAAEGLHCAQELYATGSSCVNVMIAEVMGANRGTLPLLIGAAAAADYVIVPEVEVDVQRHLLPRVRNALSQERACLVIVSEGADFTYREGTEGKRFLTPERRELPPVERKIGEALRQILINEANVPAKEVALKYLVRGAHPLPVDILRGLTAGRHAARLMMTRKNGLVVTPDRFPNTTYPLKGFFIGDEMRTANTRLTRFLVSLWNDFYGDPKA